VVAEVVVVDNLVLVSPTKALRAMLVPPTVGTDKAKPAAMVPVVAVVAVVNSAVPED
jgi:hypothetical protein